MNLPGAPVTALPGKSQKKYPKTTPSALSLAIVPVPPSLSDVLVKTVSPDDPASTGDDTKQSVTPSVPDPANKKPGTFSFASAFTTGTTKDSAENEDDDKNNFDNKKSSTNDPASNTDTKNTRKKNANFLPLNVDLSSMQIKHVLY